MKTPPCQHAKNAGAAFTLVETMLALVLASLVGLAVLSMLQVLGTATEARFSLREVLIKRQTVALRVGALLRASAMVLYLSDDMIVLWTGDANANGLPDLSELRLVRYQRSTSEVWAYEAPDTLAPGSDTTYALDDDFGAIAGAAAGSDEFPGRLALAGLSEWTVVLNDPDRHAARTARVLITSQLESGKDTTVVIASLRGAANR